MKKNVFYSILNQFLIILIPTITTPYISRILGAEGIGIIAFNYSIVLIFSMFSLLGINNYGSREIAYSRSEKKLSGNKFSEIYTMQIITSIVIIIIYLIYCLTLAGDNKSIALIQTLVLIACAFDLNWLFVGHEDFKIITIRNLFVKSIIVAMIFIFVKERNDILIYVFLNSVGILISNLSLIPFIRKYHSLFKFSFSSSIKHFKSNFILFIPIIAISMYKLVDKIVLGILSTNAEIGYYDSAMKIINIPAGIILAIGIVFYPKMSFRISQGNTIESQSKLIRNIMNISLFIAFGVVFGLNIISADFVPIFFGQGFDSVIILINTGVVIILFMSWTNIIKSMILLPLRKEKIYIISVFIGAFFNIFINILLIPKYGAFGALTATIIAELIVLIVQTLYIVRIVNIKNFLLDSIIYAISASVSYLLIYLMPIVSENKVLQIILVVFIGFFVYLILVIILTRLFNKYIFQQIGLIIKK